MSKLTPNMRHQRKAVLKLVLLSLSIFLMSAWGVIEKKEAEAAALLAGPGELETIQIGEGRSTVPRDERVAKTAAPGSSTEVPLVAGEPGEVESVEAAVATVTPAVNDCLMRWWMRDPALSEEVTLALTVGASGLEAARVLEHEGVPDGQLSCLGAALTTTWPSQPESETMSFEFAYMAGK